MTMTQPRHCGEAPDLSDSTRLAFVVAPDLSDSIEPPVPASLAFVVAPPPGWVSGPVPVSTGSPFHASSSPGKCGAVKF